MTDNEIIKALKIWLKEGDCNGECPLLEMGYCFDCACVPTEISSGILDLVNRQKEENKQLTEALECANMRIKELKTKIECNDGFDQWKHLADVTEKHYEELYQEAKESVRAEVVKEFATKFLKKVHEHHYLLTAHYNSKDYGMFTIGIEQAVNETKEEMTEVEK